MKLLDFIVSLKEPAPSRTPASDRTSAPERSAGASRSLRRDECRLQAASAVAALSRLDQGVSVSEQTPPGAEELPSKVRELAAERLRFVRLVEARKSIRRCTDREASNYVAMHHVHEFPLLRVGGKGGASALHYANYRNWKRNIAGVVDEESALRALCDRYTRGPRERRGDAMFWELFHRMYLNENKLRLTVAYRRAAEIIRKKDKETPIPSIAQVRYQIKHTAPELLILTREGEEAWRNSCCDYIRRDWSDLTPGECVIGDSRTFDTRVRVKDENTGKWKAVRPTFVGLMDARSWFLAGWWITLEPVTHETLIDTLRLYLRVTDGVPPSVVYFDNGKDYCAKGFATDFEAEGYKHSIFRELGIKLINSLPYNGRAKTIERVFRDMMQGFDRMFFDCLGSKPGERTITADYCDRHPEILPGFDQFCKIFAGWLDEWHTTPKHGGIHRGRSPYEIWGERSASGRKPLSPEHIRTALFKPEAVRTVGRGPSVKLGDDYYYCDKLAWGSRVLVKTDTLDRGHVLCCTLDGALIGEAKTRAAIRAIDGDRTEIAALMRRQRRQLLEARTAVADLTGGKSICSPVELLLAGPDAEAVRLPDSISSVKGSAHHYVHHRLIGGIEPAAQIEFREEEKEKRLAEFGSVAAPHQQEEPASSREALSSFNDFMTSRRNGDDGF